MKLSRDWLSDYIDLSGLSDAELAQRFTEIGHAVDSIEQHGGDTIFDLEITTNRVDARASWPQRWGRTSSMEHRRPPVWRRPKPAAR
jgi:hypothetical protein